jgi:hypothetical protein
VLAVQQRFIVEEPVERVGEFVAGNDCGVDHQRMRVEGPHREQSARQLVVSASPKTAARST